MEINLLSAIRRLYTPATGDTIRYVVQRPAIRRYLEKSKINNNSIAIDIGCGHGLYTYDLYAKTKNVIGIDVQISALKHNKNSPRGKDISWVCGSMENLPFKNSKFEFILCTEVLEHVTNDSLAVSELGRVLKNSGEVIMSVPLKEGVVWKEEYSHLGHKRAGYNLGEIKNLLGRTNIFVIRSSFNFFTFSRIASNMIAKNDKISNFWIIIISSLDYIIQKISKPSDIVIFARK